MASPPTLFSDSADARADEQGAAIGEPDSEAALAGLAPGLPLTPAHDSVEFSLEPSAPASRLSREIEKLNAQATEKLSHKDYRGAVDLLRRAVAMASHSAAAHGNLAYALWRNKGASQAEIHCRRAIALDPNYVQAHRILAELLRERGAPDALAVHRRLLDLDPENFIVHNNTGLLLTKLGRRSEADAAFERALLLKPGNPYIRFNQLMVREHSDLAEAIDCCLRGLEQSPNDREVLTNLAVVLQLFGGYDEALSTFERALAIDPHHVTTLINMSLLLLLRGDYARGFELYEARRQLPQVPRPSSTQPEWQGEEFEGKTILLHSEQGLGDTIQALRYVPLVAARGGRVVVRLPRPLVRLAASLPNEVVVTPLNAPTPAFDVWCPMLSLPRIFGTRVESIPATTPYLGVRAAIARRWRERLKDLSGLKVGLAWAGSAGHVNDFRRSIDLARLKPLLDVAGASFVSLQVGPRATDLAALPPGRVVDLSAELTDFGETAGAILALDLVIAVDTSIVHLAGALDKPAWVILPFSPDWRWLLDRDDSPWYPSLRLYRQRKPGEWNDVIARVGADLNARAGAAERASRARDAARQ
jgi:Flp pilus assembly protein TadD